MEVDILGDTGAYASYGVAVCIRSAVHATGPYEVPECQGEEPDGLYQQPLEWGDAGVRCASDCLCP